MLNLSLNNKKIMFKEDYVKVTFLQMKTNHTKKTLFCTNANVNLKP